MIARITRAYVRTYSDTGQVKTYVEWIDFRGRTGRTEGDRHNAHMAALVTRGRREGVPLLCERW